jgi:hypothetical protein
MGTAMRDTLLTTAMMLALTGGFAHAASTNDEVFANAALRELHNLARASAKDEQAAKDGDGIGCRNAHESIQKAAHDALVSMHSMSFQPIDAIDNVSSLLRISNSTSPDGCPYDVVTRSDMLVMTAGQAIMSLRWDYSIGASDWYMVDASDNVEPKNPIRYAQSLKDQNYSWVDVRPKGMLFMVESDWKAEMGSAAVDDPSIKNSGNNLNAVEVGYRKNSGDDNTTIYFYRTKDDAVAAARALKQHAENDAKAAAELKASVAEWSQKLASLPYMVANHDVGFKLVYAVCKRADNNAKDANSCNQDGSHDWGQTAAAPYRWFSDLDGCKDVQLRINIKHPADVTVNPDDAFSSYCVPAFKANGHAVKGYKMLFALSAAGADDDDNTYADLRDGSSRSARVFKTFKECWDAMDAAYYKAMNDLGAGKDGNLLSDKMKSINLAATCVRVY